MAFSPFSGTGGVMFSIMPGIVGIVFLLVFGFIIFGIVQSAKQWKKNNDSPILTVNATMVTKRTNVSHHHDTGNDNMDFSSSSTTYYATFQVESGDRMEFMISAQEFGMLVEGDSGKLTFQGMRYLRFERSRT